MGDSSIAWHRLDGPNVLQCCKETGQKGLHAPLSFLLLPVPTHYPISLSTWPQLAVRKDDRIHPEEAPFYRRLLNDQFVVMFTRNEFRRLDECWPYMSCAQ